MARSSAESIFGMGSGPTRSVHMKDTVFWVRHNGGANDVGMRLRNFKATRRNNGRWSLYNLESDESESNDVLSSKNYWDSGRDAETRESLERRWR